MIATAMTATAAPATSIHLRQCASATSPTPAGGPHWWSASVDDDDYVAQSNETDNLP